MASSNTSATRRSRPIPPPISPIPPPSSVYSQQQQQNSAAFFPVSPLSSVPGAQPAGGRRSNTSALYTPHRPTSSTFFRQEATGTANPSLNPPYPNNADDEGDDNMLGGYDGAYDRLPPTPPPPRFTNPFSRKSKLRDHHPLDTDSHPALLKDAKKNPKKKSKSSSSSSSSSSKTSMRKKVLRVDESTSLPATTKMGLWLMGTTPQKMEKAARAGREKRGREREGKRVKREGRRAARRGEDDHKGGDGEEWEGGMEGLRI